MPSRLADSYAQRHAEPASPLRRRIVGCVGVVFASLAAAVLGIPIVGFLLTPLFREEAEEWQAVGAVDGFETGATVKVSFREPTALPWAGYVANNAAWLRRRNEQEFIAFSLYCSHLGCPIRWEAGAQLFMCPCHGGIFYADGTVASGPPRAALSLYPVRVRNGQVEILPSHIPLPAAPG